MNAAAHCGNCQQAWIGPFCHGCGLKRPRGRLTLPGLLADLGTRLVDLEHGLARTFWGLLVRPKVAVQAYLDGQRKRYSHPFAFLLIAATLSLLSVSLLGDAFWEAFRTTVTLGAKNLTVAQRERFADFYEHLFAALPYWMLILSLPTAVLLRLLFPRRGFSVAELWVAAIYATGLAIAIDVPMTLILANSGVSMAIQMLCTSALIIAAQIWVLGQFLGPGPWTWLRAATATLIGYLLITMLQTTASFTYARWPV